MNASGQATGPNLTMDGQLADFTPEGVAGSAQPPSAPPPLTTKPLDGLEAPYQRLTKINMFDNFRRGMQNTIEFFTPMERFWSFFKHRHAALASLNDDVFC